MPTLDDKELDARASTKDGKASAPNSKKVVLIASGGITSDDYEAAEPGSGTLGEEILLNRSSAGWSLDVGILNLSEEPSDFTVRLLDEEGEELSSKEVELEPSLVQNVQIYLPQDYEAGTVTVRLDSPLLGEGLTEEEVVVGE